MVSLASRARRSVPCRTGWRPFRRAAVLVAVGVALLVGAGAGPRVVPEASAREATLRAPLSARLGARVDSTGARDRQVAVTVVDRKTGAEVFSRNGMVPLVPASIAKVPTAVAALDLLGPGHRFRTVLSGRGEMDAATGTLRGDLVLSGSGDPALSRRSAHPMDPLRTLAAAAAALGLKRVTGALVLDDGPFDREFVHPTWTAGDLAQWYGAPVCGLSFNDGCATVVVRGREAAGRSASVTCPATSGPWPVTGEIATTDERAAQVGGGFTPDGRLRVFGRIGVGVESAFDTPVPDPLAFVGEAALAALSAAGVTVVGGARPARDAADRAGAVEIAAVEGDLAFALRTMNRRSQNLYASLLFKAAGAAREGLGSWASGERAVADALARRGLRAEGERVVDGAGLSKDSRLSSATLARLLASVDRDLLTGELLRDSLAAPGEEGTLMKRLRDARDRARLRAKTGTLGRSGVHALAGYVDARSGGGGFAFAVIVNDGRVDGRALCDDVARLLLEE